MECKNCGEPAKLACSSCKAAPVIQSDAPMAHYCSATCQKDDWVNHKPTCHRLKDRTFLYRIAKFTQKLYYFNREITWCQFKIEDVEKHGMVLLLRGMTMPNNEWPRNYMPFPSDLLPNEEDRQAILTFRSCRDSLMWGLEFMDGLMKEIVVTIEIVKFRTKNDRRRVSILPSGMPNQVTHVGNILHEILKVTLRSGEAFALDISGAQYGYHDPMTPWCEYNENRIDAVLDLRLSGDSSNLIDVDDYTLTKMLSLFKKIAGKHAPGRSLSGDAIAAINLHLLEWQADERLSLKDMWKLPEAKFQAKMADVVNFIDWKSHSVPSKAYFTVNGRRLRRENPVRWIHGK